LSTAAFRGRLSPVSDRTHSAEVGRLLVVPRRPGNLLDPECVSRPRAPDEIDELVTELFGPDPGGSPGWFDGVLVAIGLALIAWAELRSHSLALTIVGVVLACLGLVLPVRSGWRWLNARRRSRRRDAILMKVAVLDVSDPLVRRLAESHDALLKAAAEPGMLLHQDAVSAAHLALVESAALLAGRSPSTQFEREYLLNRVEAIAELTRAIEEHDAVVRRELLEDAEIESRLEREARARAGEELDATGLSSLQELKDLTALFGSTDRDPAS
jgi:hypothetical protein